MSKNTPVVLGYLYHSSAEVKKDPTKVLSLELFIGTLMNCDYKFSDSSRMNNSLRYLCKMIPYFDQGTGEICVIYCIIDRILKLNKKLKVHENIREAIEYIKSLKS